VKRKKSTQVKIRKHDDKILFDSYDEMHPHEDMKGDRRKAGLDPLNVAPWLQPSQKATR
jgi:hypothetical protein